MMYVKTNYLLVLVLGKIFYLHKKYGENGLKDHKHYDTESYSNDHMISPIFK
jgi:hypothetical protein